MRVKAEMVSGVQAKGRSFLGEETAGHGEAGSCWQPRCCPGMRS